MVTNLNSKQTLRITRKEDGCADVKLKEILLIMCRILEAKIGTKVKSLLTCLKYTTVDYFQIEKYFLLVNRFLIVKCKQNAPLHINLLTQLCS